MMRLRQIVKQRWTVLAICDDRGECRVSYDTGRIVVCSAAMHKPKKAELDRVIERALSDRQRYFNAKRRNQIEIIKETL